MPISCAAPPRSPGLLSNAWSLLLDGNTLPQVRIRDASVDLTCSLCRSI